MLRPICTAALVAAASLPAAAQTAPAAPAPPAPPAAAPPVTVKGCEFSPRTLFPNGSQGRITISFAVGAAPVDAVVFRVRWGDGSINDLTDAGRFAAASSVSHTLVFDRNGPISAAFWSSVNVNVDSVARGGQKLWEAARGAEGVSCAVYQGP